MTHADANATLAKREIFTLAIQADAILLTGDNLRLRTSRCPDLPRILSLALPFCPLAGNYDRHLDTKLAFRCRQNIDAHHYALSVNVRSTKSAWNAPGRVILAMIYSRTRICHVPVTLLPRLGGWPAADKPKATAAMRRIRPLRDIIFSDRAACGASSDLLRSSPAPSPHDPPEQVPPARPRAM